MLNTLLGSRSYSTYRFNMHQNILADIIKGASEEEAVQRISVANLSFPSHMLATVFKPSFFRESEFLHDVLMPGISALLPNVPKLYQKGTMSLCSSRTDLAQCRMGSFRVCANWPLKRRFDRRKQYVLQA